MKPEVIEIQRDINQAMNLAQETILRGAAMPWVGKRPKITRWDRVRIWLAAGCGRVPTYFAHNKPEGWTFALGSGAIGMSGQQPINFMSTDAGELCANCGHKLDKHGIYTGVPDDACRFNDCQCNDFAFADGGKLPAMNQLDEILWEGDDQGHRRRR